MKKLIIIFLFIPFLVSAQTTYYVSVDSALNTIAEVNALSLVAGDSVLFHRGETWVVTQADFSDGLQPDNNGSAGNRIVYSAYGTGAKPIITGRQSLTGWNTSGNWTNVTGNIWSLNATGLWTNTYADNQRGRLWLDGVEVLKAESTTVPTASNPWTHNGNILYIYSVGNPSGVYSDIESLGPSPVVCYVSADYVTIEYIDFRGSGNLFQITGADSLVIDSCNIGWDCGQSGFEITYGGNASDNVVIKNSLFDTNDHNDDAFEMNNTEDGIILSDGCDGWKVYNNTFIGWGHTAFNYGVTTTAAINCKFYNNDISCPDSDYGRGFTYNVAVAVGTGNCTGNEIYNNLIHNTPTMNQISGDGLKFYCNIIDTVRGTSYRASIGHALSINPYAGACENNEIYNNIFANADDNGLWIPYSTGGTRDNLIKNNIFIDNTLYQLRYEFSGDNGASIGSNTFQNNIFYKSGTSDVVFYEKMADGGARPMTVAEFNAMNGITTGMTSGEVADVITNNLQSDPTLVGGSPYDYTLQAGSPAIATGIGVGLTLDKAGNVWAATPSIGAYEYNGTPPDPPGLPEVTTSTATYTAITANVSYEITSDGGGTLTNRGVCWSTSANPTTSNSKTIYTASIGSFTDVLRGLSGGTTYHVRAYTTNESGTAYGADYSFTTPVSSQGKTSGKIGMTNGKIGILK